MSDDSLPAERITEACAAMDAAIAAGMTWSAFWAGMGLAGLVISALLLFLLPTRETTRRDDWLKSATHAMKTVFSNPQSILCGIIAGLLFIPTTIFDMVWGVRFLQDAVGFDYGSAVLRSSMVPFGWMLLP